MRLASATTARPRCLAASNSATLMLTKRARGKAVWEAVVKSVQRVPIPITRSASRARRLAASPPLTPTGPTFCGWSQDSDPLPAWVSATGMPVRSQKRASSASASE